MTFTVPVRTRNPLNGSQGRTRAGMFARARDRRRIRDVTRYAALAEGIGSAPPLPVTVELVRVAPSDGLDEHDGLVAALKPVVDGLADWLGLASDRDPRVRWRYAQRRGRPREYAVEVEVATDTGGEREDTT